eukprot:COSAG01_NODE_69587_length_261_cov_0.586420_1_plen_75_part_01
MAWWGRLRGLARVHLREREAVEEGLRSVGGLAGSAVKQTRDKLRTLVAPSYVLHIVPGEIMLAVRSSWDHHEIIM